MAQIVLVQFGGDPSPLTHINEVLGHDVSVLDVAYDADACHAAMSGLFKRALAGEKFGVVFTSIPSWAFGSIGLLGSLGVKVGAVRWALFDCEMRATADYPVHIAGTVEKQIRSLIPNVVVQRFGLPQDDDYEYIDVIAVKAIYPPARVFQAVDWLFNTACDELEPAATRNEQQPAATPNDQEPAATPSEIAGEEAE